MKRLLLLGVGSALMFTMGGVGSAQADSNSSTHRSTAAKAGAQDFLVSAGGGRCASCHRAHTAKAEYLLKQAQPGLCYTCHGALGSNLDVIDGVKGGSAEPRAALRGGGFEYARIDGAGAKKTMPTVLDQYAHPESETVPVLATATAVTSRHQIDGTTQGTMWGNGAVSANVGGTDALATGKTGVTLECGSCHDPHGNGNYRILRPVPNGAATKGVTAKAEQFASPVIWDDPSTPDVNEYKAAVLAAPAVTGVAAVDVAPVNIPDATLKNYTTTNYWLVADRFAGATNGTGTATDPYVPVAAGTTDGYIANVAAWCTTCHTRYLAGSGSYKTPLTGKDAAGATIQDATFTYRHRSDRADKDGLNVPNCIQCHVSHGTNVAMTGRAESFTAPDGQVPTAKGGVATPYTSGGVAYPGTSGTPVGTSRLLRVDNRGTCEMCHNV